MTNDTVIAAFFLQVIHDRLHFKCSNIPHRNAHHEFMCMQYMVWSSIPKQIIFQNKTKTIQDDRIEEIFHIFFRLLLKIGPHTDHTQINNNYQAI